MEVLPRVAIAMVYVLKLNGVQWIAHHFILFRTHPLSSFVRNLLRREPTRSQPSWMFQLLFQQILHCFPLPLCPTPLRLTRCLKSLATLPVLAYLRAWTIPQAWTHRFPPSSPLIPLDHKRSRLMPSAPSNQLHQLQARWKLPLSATTTVLCPRQNIVLQLQ